MPSDVRGQCLRGVGARWGNNRRWAPHHKNSREKKRNNALNYCAVTHIITTGICPTLTCGVEWIMADKPKLYEAQWLHPQQHTDGPAPPALVVFHHGKQRNTSWVFESHFYGKAGINICCVQTDSVQCTGSMRKQHSSKAETLKHRGALTGSGMNI